MTEMTPERIAEMLEKHARIFDMTQGICNKPGCTHDGEQAVIHREAAAWLRRLERVHTPVEAWPVNTHREVYALKEPDDASSPSPSRGRKETE